MRIIENVETIVTVQDLKGIVCNKCGEVFSPHDDNIQTLNTPLGEYGDCKYDICNKCTLEFIRGFAIVPTSFKSSPNFTSSFDLDHELHQQLFDKWKESGIWDCDENPWRDYYSIDGSDQELESYKDYFEENENINTRKVALHKGFKIVK